MDLCIYARIQGNTKKLLYPNWTQPRVGTSMGHAVHRHGVYHEMNSSEVRWI